MWSTRKVTPRAARAISVPFFLHLNPDVLIDVLPSCITPDNPKRYPTPITANDYLWERLREIKLG